jgi:hypothetical protein
MGKKYMTLAEMLEKDGILSKRISVLQGPGVKKDDPELKKLYDDYIENQLKYTKELNKIQKKQKLALDFIKTNVEFFSKPITFPEYFERCIDSSSLYHRQKITELSDLLKKALGESDLNTYLNAISMMIRPAHDNNNPDSQIESLLERNQNLVHTLLSIQNNKEYQDAIALWNDQHKGEVAKSKEYLNNLQEKKNPINDPYFGKDGLFKRYLQERHETYWLTDFFAKIASFILGYVGEQQKREAYVAALKTAVGKNNLAEVLTEDKINSFKSRAKDAEKNSFQAKLKLFKAAVAQEAAPPAKVNSFKKE